jgi:hypothetical protein
MRIKLCVLLFLLLAACCIGVVGQSVVITGKKVTYTRKKPFSEYKKTFTIRYPKVQAATPALSKRIENAISYGINIKAEQNDDGWLDEADYEVTYNQNGILSVALTTDGSGAYPSGYTKHAVVDLKTGARLRPANSFTDLPRLLKLIRQLKDKQVAQAMADIKRDPGNGDVDAEDLFIESAKYQRLKLDDFSVGKNGVTFYHDYAFPHVALALQPSGEFKFTWKQLKPYIKPGGLLAHIVR